MRTLVVGAATVLLTAVVGWSAPAPAVPGILDGYAAPYNAYPITIAAPNGTEATQPVDPYPATNTVWGVDGPITDVDVELDNVSLWRPSEIYVLLVSPSGTGVVLMDGNCGNTSVSNRYWRFDDEATTYFGATAAACASGTYHLAPTVDSPLEAFPPPAPAGPYGFQLRNFDGENPNGNWRLYVFDTTPRHDGQPVPEDHGEIKFGFRVHITTATQPIVIGDYTGFGPATPYPYVIPVSGQVGRIEDVYVYLEGLGHDYPDDLDVLLVAPTGQSVLLVSDACGNHRLRLNTTWRIHDGDPAFPDEADCGTAGAGGAGYNFSPTDYQPGDLFPAPAPAGPYGHYLAGLDGLDPNGDWKLYIKDDGVGGSGYLGDAEISFTLGPPVVDTTAPDTTITTNPGATSTSRRATFAFTATESPATFQCRLDDARWSACTSPSEVRRLSVGRHVLRVRATDAAGNVDPTPARWVWRRTG